MSLMPSRESFRGVEAMGTTVSVGTVLDSGMIEGVVNAVFRKLARTPALRNPEIVAALGSELADKSGFNSMGACFGAIAVATALNHLDAETRRKTGEKRVEGEPFRVVVVKDHEEGLLERLRANGAQDPEKAYSLLKEHIIMVGPDGKVYDVTPAKENQPAGFCDVGRFEAFPAQEQASTIDRIIGQNGGLAKVLEKVAVLARSGGALLDIEPISQRVDSILQRVSGAFEQAVRANPMLRPRAARPVLAL